MISIQAISVLLSIAGSPAAAPANPPGTQTFTGCLGQMQFVRVYANIRLEAEVISGICEGCPSAVAGASVVGIDGGITCLGDAAFLSDSDGQTSTGCPATAEAAAAASLGTPFDDCLDYFSLPTGSFAYVNEATSDCESFAMEIETQFLLGRADWEYYVSGSLQESGGGSAVFVPQAVVSAGCVATGTCNPTLSVDIDYDFQGSILECTPGDFGDFELTGRVVALVRSTNGAIAGGISGGEDGSFAGFGVGSGITSASGSFSYQTGDRGVKLETYGVGSPDLNDDGSVCTPDVVVFVAALGSDYTDATYNVRCDFDGDGDVDGGDRLLFLTAYETYHCLADYDCNGTLSPDDLDSYITDYYTSPAPANADINVDGIVSPDDLDDFITIYFDGCP